jgi:hypothetical protein
MPAKINAPNGKHIVNDKFVISARDSSTNWLSKIGQFI